MTQEKDVAALVAKLKDAYDYPAENIHDMPEWCGEAATELTRLATENSRLRAALTTALLYIEFEPIRPELEAALQPDTGEVVAELHVSGTKEEWLAALAPEPGAIMICPERDGPCPHGLNCPYADRYGCKPGWQSRPIIPPMEEGA